MGIAKNHRWSRTGYLTGRISSSIRTLRRTKSLREYGLGNFFAEIQSISSSGNKYAKLPPGPVYSGPSARAFWDICERFEPIPAPPAMTITDPEFKWRPWFTTQNPRHWTLPINFSVDSEFEMPAIDLEDPSEIVVKFNVRSQIKPQLNYVAKLLKAEVKRLTDAELLGGEPRARVDKFKNYLRVLDAKSSGITNKAIAVEILGIDNPNNPNNPENQKDIADFAFKSAKRLRDGGYRFLAAMG